MTNAKKTLSLVSCCIELFTCCFCNNLGLRDTIQVSILYNDATISSALLMTFWASCKYMKRGDVIWPLFMPYLSYPKG